MLTDVKKKNRKRPGIAVALVMTVILAWCCSSWFFQLMLIQGDSMTPAYHHLQMVVLNKRDRQFHQGDVIAFRCPGLSSVLVKRIIACPGDTACIRNGTLYIQDRPSTVYSTPGTIGYAGLLNNPLALQEGEYLVVGDNIEGSVDSRYPEVGIVKEKEIVGKVL